MLISVTSIVIISQQYFLYSPAIFIPVSYTHLFITASPLTEKSSTPTLSLCKSTTIAVTGLVQTLLFLCPLACSPMPMQKNAIPIMPHININNSINVVISISSYLSRLIKSISLFHNKNFLYHRSRQQGSCLCHGSRYS